MGRRRHCVRRLALLVAALAASLASAACEAPRSDGMRLVWSDEFDSAGLPDPARWGYEVGRVRNHEWQYYTHARAENASVADGVLTIAARRDSFEGERYTSASLTTRSTFTFTYGRVVVRAKVPRGRGTWPAAWMLGTAIDTVGWPRCGEIDIVENVGYDPSRFHFTVHTAKYNHVANTQSTSSVTADDPWGWHEYQVDWDRQSVRFAMDGREVHVFRNDGTGPEAWPFDGPMYLILNLAIGGDWGGQQGVDDSIFPALYQVDYVRVYQQG